MSLLPFRLLSFAFIAFAVMGVWLTILEMMMAAMRAKGQGVIMAPPKTDRGRRTITIDPETVELLRQHRGRQLVSQVELNGVYQNLGYVVAEQLGEPLDPFKLTNVWRRLCEGAGMDGIRLHDMRHFHATMLLREGINPKVVLERLGHSSISVTLDVYSHVILGLQEKAAQTFADAMREDRTGGWS